MKNLSRRAAIALAAAAAAVSRVSHAAQEGLSREQDEPRLPNGKSQRDAISKAEYEQNVKDAARLADLAERLKEGLEKDDRFVLSLDTIKITDEIEKLAQKIRARLRHN